MVNLLCVLCTLCMLCADSLFDPEKQLDLDWRVAGDTWEPEVESDDEGEEEGGAAEQGAGGEAEQGALPDHAMTSSEILTILDEK
jgi:hypothetical protein